jgi:hypothetical protein
MGGARRWPSAEVGTRERMVAWPKTEGNNRVTGAGVDAGCPAGDGGISRAGCLPRRRTRAAGGAERIEVRDA